ncbi:PAS domain S-box protein [Leptolyngbya sp. NM2-A1]
MTQLLRLLTVSIGESEDFNGALHSVLQQVCELTDWSIGEAWLPSEDEQTLYCAAIWHNQETPQEQAFWSITREFRPRRGSGLPGRVWQQQQPEWIPDVSVQSPQEFLRLQAALGLGIKAGLAVPILAGQRLPSRAAIASSDHRAESVVAVLCFFMFESRPEDPALVDLVTAIAAQLGPIMRLKQTYESQTASQTQLMSLIDSLPGIVFAASADPDWTMQYLSQGCYALTGYTPEELAGPDRTISYNAITDPDDLPQVLQSIGEAIAQDQPYVVEYRIRTKAGSERWVWEKGYGVYDSSGEVSGLKGFITDTTDRRQTEEALRTSEARFRSLFYGAVIGVCGSAIPGVVGECNRAYQQMIGYTSKETRCLPIATVTHPDDLDADFSLYQEVLNGTRDSYQLEKRFIRKDGVCIWGRLTIFAVRDADGTLFYIFALVEDINERKQTEAAMLRRETQARQLLQAIPEMLFVIDEQGTYLHAQAEREDDLLLPAGELVGHTMDHILPADVVEGVRTIMQIARATGQSQVLEYQLKIEEETRYFDGRVTPYGEESFVVTVRNITERKRAERAIQDKEAFLRLILDTIPQHIFWKGTNLAYQGANRAFALSAGFGDPQEIIGKTDQDLWELDQATGYQANDRWIIQTHQPLLNIVRQKQMADGSTIWQNVDKVPIRDATGTVIGVLGTYEDITEQKRTEEALAKRQQYLSVLVALQNQLLATEDLTLVYPQALALLGQVSSASRVYIFENHYNGRGQRCMTQTQEWCAPGIEPHLGNPALRELPYSQLPRLESRLASGRIYTGLPGEFPTDEQQVFQGQGILAILLLPLLVNDQFFGFLGFDNCVEAKLWEPAELDLLRAGAAALSLALERQGAIAAVRQSEARYRLLAENSNDVISRHSTESHLLYVSPACLTLLGYSADVLLGQPMFSLVHPDDQAEVKRHFLSILEIDAETIPYTYRVRHHNGDYLWLETLSRAVRDEATGTVTEIISVSRDVTERRAASDLLSGQKRVLEMIARDRPLTETLTEILRAIQSQNSGTAVAVTLLDADGLHFHHKASLNLPLDYVALLDGIAIGPEAGSCGTAMFCKKTVICHDIATDPLWKECRHFPLNVGLQACWSMPIISSQGKVLGTISSYHNTPYTPTAAEIQLVEMAQQMAAIALEQKLAVEGLQRAEAKYRGIFENAVEGIFQSTVEGHYITVNPMLANIYGYNSPEELMESLTDISHQLYVVPDRRQEFVRIMEEQGMVQGFESQVYRQDGSVIWISECARALKDEAGNILGYEGTVENITRRKQAETELIKRDNLLQGVAQATHYLLTNTAFEEAIQQALSILGQAAGVDRVYIYENHPHPDHGDVSMTLRYEWTQPSVPSALGLPHWCSLSYSEAGLAHWYDRFLQGRSVIGITRFMSAAEQEILNRDHIRSIIMVPIFVNNSLWGYIGFDECHTERWWTASEESMLVAIAASIGGAIQRQHTEAQMRYQAFHDALTGLPNRAFYDHHLDIGLAHSRRNNETFGVMFLDLDRFKTINDTLGHAVGDQLLKLTTQRLTQCLRDEDIIARWGGDEFTLLLPSLKTPEDAAKVAQRISRVLKPVFRLDNHDLHITCSIGIAIYPQDGEDADTLLKNADVALYRAKEQGRNNYQFYTAALNSRASERLTLDNSLHRALERHELVLYYQPQLNLETGQITQIEALVRWQHPELGLLSPQKFIPLAEENGLIVPIGEWVLQTACAQIKQWHDMGMSDLRMAVNLSAHQFQQPNLVEQIAHILQQSGLSPQHLELEITETAFMKDVQVARVLLHLLREMGIRIALDDFGTGYSSMYYLREFPLNSLKIDRSFIRDLEHSSQAIAIIEAIITLGRGLNLNVVAEGVETIAQQEQLRSLYCQEMQGFLFSPPLDTQQATLFLQHRYPYRSPTNSLRTYAGPLDVEL